MCVESARTLTCGFLDSASVFGVVGVVLDLFEVDLRSGVRV